MTEEETTEETTELEIIEMTEGEIIEMTEVIEIRTDEEMTDIAMIEGKYFLKFIYFLFSLFQFEPYFF